MSDNLHIVDNRRTTAASYLRKALKDADSLSVVSAYFSVYGFGALERVLKDLGEVRFLYGDKGSIEDVDPNQVSKSYELFEGRLKPSHSLEQQALAKRCSEWVEQKSVEVRAVERSNFMHGKMYLADGKEPRGLVGSSNFTKNGLGEGLSGNLEINLAVDDPDVLQEMRDWFKDVWESDLTKDVKGELLTELSRLGKDQSPQDVYFKTLYEIFRAEIENDALTDFEGRTKTLKESVIWNALYKFQQDGALNAIRRIEEFGGCILADSVGLGKTYTALAVIKYFLLRNKHVLVMCPKKLQDNWERYQNSAGQIGNPFRDDRLDYALRAHTDLSRELPNFNWSNYDLVVIDESHNFRNRLGKRYEKMLNDVILRGADTKVLMLSATPVNTSVADLEGQIGLMSRGAPDTLGTKLGVPNVSGVLRTAKDIFEDWQKAGSTEDRKKDKLITELSSEFKHILDRVSIARSRKHIESYYKAEMERIGQFPERLKPIERSPESDLKQLLPYKQVGDEIAKLKLAMYMPSHYTANASPRDEQVQEYLVKMIKANFLKRLESSAHSLRLTLERTVAKMEHMITKVEDHIASNAGAGPTSTSVELETDEDLDEVTAVEFAELRQGNILYHLHMIDTKRWLQVLEFDRNLLQSVLDRIALVTPERDGKLAQLKHDIRERFGPAGRSGGKKLLLFTTFKDTADYLYAQLGPIADELGIRNGMVAGDTVRVASGRPNFHEVLDRFAPVARRGPDYAPDDEIDLLIATDCISEGQNLQDCDRVLNYDIHWNPVRLTQRFGRIDRIGSKAKNVQMINYWPTADMEEQIDLKRRVLSRSVLVDVVATADDNQLVAGELAEMTYRDGQLQAMRRDGLSIDEFDDVVTLSDFTLDDFRAQLAAFIEQNKERLEKMPLGVYAVTSPPEQLNLKTPSELRSGVIWCVRQVNAAEREPGTTTPSPVYPCYLVYVWEDGQQVRLGCSNAERILRIFEATSLDKAAPDKDLSSWFDTETDYGRDTAQYSESLGNALGDVKAQHEERGWRDFSLGGDPTATLPVAGQAPSDETKLELVTWLVIKG